MSHRNQGFLHGAWHSVYGKTSRFKVTLLWWQPVLYGEVYGVLRELAFSAQVRLAPEVRTLVWPNGAGFDPYVLHEWSRAVEQLAQRLRQPVVA